MNTARFESLTRELRQAPSEDPFPPRPAASLDPAAPLEIYLLPAELASALGFVPRMPWSSPSEKN